MVSAVREVCDFFWAGLLAASPELGTYLGQDVNPTGMDTYTEETYLQRKRLAEEVLRRLEAIPHDTVLSEEDQLNSKVLRRYARVCIEGVELRHFLMAVFHDSGPHVFFIRYTKDRMPFTEPQHYHNYCHRLRLFPKQVQEAQGLLALGLAEGITLHCSSMGPTAGMLEKIISCAPEDTEFYIPFKNIPSEFPLDIRDGLVEQGRNLVRQCVQTSLKDLQQFIQEEYMPHCRPDISLNSLPQPSSSTCTSRYDAMLRFHCDTQLTGREMHELGLKQVERLEQDIQKLMDRIGFRGNVHEFSEHLASREDQFFHSQEELFEYCNNLLSNQIRPALERLFHPFPALPLRIVASRSAQLALAIYNAPTAGFGREGQLWMSPRALKTPKYKLMTLILHEAEPGHHYQACHMVARPDLPSFRRYKDDRKYFEVPARFPMNTAHTEGWGLYSEELGMELGLFADPYDEFGFLDQNIKRAMRMVIDPALHALGWSREQASEYMLAHGPWTPEAVNKELDRYIAMPGQACSYTYGLLKIRELRHMAENRLGEHFDVRDFHSACLRHGQLPLDLLEDAIKSYVTDTLNNS